MKDSSTWSLFPSRTSDMIAETVSRNLVNTNSKTDSRFLIRKRVGWVIDCAVVKSFFSNPSDLGHMQFDQKTVGALKSLTIRYSPGAVAAC